MTLSVIIITKNEEQNIRACLESVVWADEIIVVDSGSSDNTVGICKNMGAQVHVMDWPGFGPQKNRALNLSTGDWVLSLDADERVSSELRSEIQSAIANPVDAVAFRVPRSSSYCGRIMRHSGWWPDYVMRLFKRGHARFSDDPVHERLIVEGKTATFQQPLLHEAFRSLEQVLLKLNDYSTTGATMLHRQQRKASLGMAICHGLWTFVRTYFLRTGFLDGREGFMLAVSNAEGAYYRYLKAMLLQEKQKTLP
ncbi:MAG: glycosyltransferase family 2 protein [Burkholderiales bacterium]